jgi:hypothetical protein
MTLDSGNGELIDCIETRLQHGFNNPMHAFAAPPPAPLPIANTPSAPHIQGYGTVSAFCPEGTIPRVRVTVAQVERFGSLANYFRKGRHAGLPTLGPTDEHQYATTRQFVQNTGAFARINIWQPYVQLLTEFSISQIWVAGGEREDDSLETVEAGSQVYPQKYGDALAHIVVYFTPDNYGPLSCYNLDCPWGGFTQVNSSVALGGHVPTWAQSVSGGQQLEQWFQLKQSDDLSWWFGYAGQWIGYWAASRFDVDGLRYGANRIDFGGEITNKNIGAHTTTDMGSGGFAGATDVASYRYAAYQRNLGYWTTHDAGSWYDMVPAGGGVTSAACYNTLVGFQNQVPGGPEAGRRYMYFGGPGYNANCE